jgi:hypothetical protein
MSRQYRVFKEGFTQLGPFSAISEALLMEQLPGKYKTLPGKLVVSLDEPGASETVYRYEKGDDGQMHAKAILPILR